jgi:hypothetical protein
VKRVLVLKFTKEADGYHHARADAEIALAKTARDNGGKHVGKSGKASQTRTGKRGQKPTKDITQEVTDTATGEITETPTHKGHPYSRTTVQPSNPPTVQPKTGGKPSRTSRSPSPPVEPDDTADLQARNARIAAETPFPEDLVTGTELPWWHSPNGWTSKGRELGVTLADEDFTEFQAKVVAVAGPGPWETDLPHLADRIEHYRAVGVSS